MYDTLVLLLSFLSVCSRASPHFTIFTWPEAASTINWQLYSIRVWKCVGNLLHTFTAADFCHLSEIRSGEHNRVDPMLPISLAVSCPVVVHDRDTVFSQALGNYNNCECPNAEVLMRKRQSSVRTILGGNPLEVTRLRVVRDVRRCIFPGHICPSRTCCTGTVKT